VNRRPLLASTAALAALTLAAASGTAAGATATPAAGSASTTLSVLRVLAGGHDLSAVDLALRSDTTSSPRVSRIDITPITADGTAYGRVVVNQANSPQGVSALSTPSALSPYAQLVSPALTASATSLPSNQIGAASLGSLKVLGLPVALGGALQAASSVTGTGGASAGKTVTLSNVALPSIADVLAALGLDLSKLPVGSLSTLLSQLDLVTSAVTTAQNAVNTAQSAVDAQVATLAGLTATLTTDQGLLATAQTTLTTATSALQTLLNDPLVTALTGGVPLTVAQFEALVASADPLVALIEAIPVVGPLVTSAQTDYVSALAAVTAAQNVVALAQAAVDAAQALLTTLTATLTSAISTLLGAITGVLDATPLVSLTKLELSTKALVTSATTGGQSAQIVGGTISGLKVLGTDVLQTALGSSTIDLSALAGTAVTTLTSTISGLTGTLSSVLSSIPGLPVLDIPAPKIGLLTKSTSTSISGGYGRASTLITGLSITLPSITLPTSVALPGAVNLPAMDGITQVAGQLTSAPVTVSLLTLRDQAAFRPAVAGTGTTGGTNGSQDGGSLPDTGLPVGVAALSLLLVGGALALRRKVLNLG
jgi:hypothetical protein